MTVSWRVAAASDVGLLRDGNEDSAYAGSHLLAVADGMGGAAAGEVASSVVIASLVTLDEDDPGADPLASLSETLEQAEEQLSALVAAEPRLSGMGTTLTAVLRSGSRLALLHVGDSRGYLWRDDVLEPITKDHTLVQSLVDAGRLTEEQAHTHPQRNILTRTLDGTGPTQPDLSVRELHPGDRVLLCSDGLTSVVSVPTIVDTLRTHAEPEAAVAALIELALRAGAPDNVTCVVAVVVEDDEETAVDPVVVGAVGLHRRSRRISLPNTPAGRAAALVDGPAAAPVVRATRRRRRRVVWLTAGATLLVGVLLGSLLGWYVWARQQYYVGSTTVDGREVVAVYRGPADPLFGLQLSDVVASTDLEVTTLPEFERDQLTETIPARSESDAQDIVQRLRDEAAACLTDRPPAGCPEVG